MYCEPEEKKNFLTKFSAQDIFLDISFWQEILEKSKFDKSISYRPFM